MSNWNKNKPSKEGKYLAFVTHHRVPQYLVYDTEFGDKPFWHRAGLNQEVEVEYWIEDPYAKQDAKEEKAVEKETPKDEEPEEVKLPEIDPAFKIGDKEDESETEEDDKDSSDEDEKSDKPAKKKGGRPKKTE